MAGGVADHKYRRIVFPWAMFRPPQPDRCSPFGDANSVSRPPMDTVVNTLQPDRSGSSGPMSHPVDSSHRQSLSVLRDSVPPDTKLTIPERPQACTGSITGVLVVNCPSAPAEPGPGFTTSEQANFNDILHRGLRPS